MTKTLLIDYDGTLVPQRRGLKGYFLWNGLRRLQGQCSPLKALRAALQIRRALPKSNGEHSIQQISETLFQNYTDLSAAAYHEMCQYALFHSQKHQLVDGAHAFIQWAKERYRLILATSPIFSQSVLRQRLEWAGLEPDDFTALTSSECFHWIKPQTNYFKQILDLYSLQAEDCLMIGNDAVKDLPARDCGIPLALLASQAPEPGVNVFQEFSSLQTWMEARS